MPSLKDLTQGLISHSVKEISLSNKLIPLLANQSAWDSLHGSFCVFPFGKPPFPINGCGKASSAVGCSIGRRHGRETGQVDLDPDLIQSSRSGQCLISRNL
jgi:hypothetical protein